MDDDVLPLRLLQFQRGPPPQKLRHYLLIYYFIPIMKRSVKFGSALGPQGNLFNKQNDKYQSSFLFDSEALYAFLKAGHFFVIRLFPPTGKFARGRMCKYTTTPCSAGVARQTKCLRESFLAVRF